MNVHQYISSFNCWILKTSTVMTYICSVYS